MVFFVIAFYVLFINFPLFASVKRNAGVSIHDKLAMLEKNSGGQLGVYAINTSNNQMVAYHANKRFPLCSTNKVMGVAAILKMSEAMPGFLEETVKYRQSDMVVWSPATKKYHHSGMTIGALCKAAITLSDNTAMNLLMQRLGGPAGVTAFARSIGDEVFNLERWEPELNTAILDDLRDTSTPEAMGSSLHKLVLSHTLATDRRNLLKTWLIENTTGNTSIRAGTPKGWIVGDKTGTCRYGTMNDIGIIWPPQGEPMVLAIYYTQRQESIAPNGKVIASVTRMVLEAFSQYGTIKLSNNGQTSAKRLC